MRWAVLWDMDGTLVDTEPYWRAAQQGLARASGLVWSAADHRAVMGKSMDATALRLQQLGMNRPVATIIGLLVDHVVEALDGQIPWLPGAQQLLAGLADAGVPCALVTMAHSPLPQLIAAAAPPGAFVAVVTGGDVSRGKPHPEPYLRAANLVGVDPACCVAIEDSPSGAMSAEAARMPVVVVPGALSVPTSPSRHFAASLTKLTVAGLQRIVRLHGLN